MSFCGKSLIFINYITQWMNCCSDYLFLRIIESKLSSISKNYLISCTPFFDLSHVIMWSSAVPPHILCDHLLKPPSPLVIQSDLVSIPLGQCKTLEWPISPICACTRQCHARWQTRTSTSSQPVMVPWQTHDIFLFCFVCLFVVVVRIKQLTDVATIVLKKVLCRVA